MMAKNAENSKNKPRDIFEPNRSVFFASSFSKLYHHLMPTYFETVLNTTITLIYLYPLPIIINHHFWYFHDLDFFVTIRSIVYRLHRWHFELSSFFSDILNRNKPGHDIPRETSIHLPIPFDDLLPPTFFVFLHDLYYLTLFIGTKDERKDIRWLSLEWDLPQIAGFAALWLL